MRKNIAGQSELETRTFYCNVETYLGRKDYLRGGRCVRLIGVEHDDFLRLNQGDHRDGVCTFLIDVDLSSFLWIAQTKIWRLKREAKAHELAFLDSEFDNASTWYQVDFHIAAKGRSYFYSTFSAEEPIFIDPIRISSIDAPRRAEQSSLPPKLTGFLKATQKVTSMTAVDPGYGIFKFTAFHVGQGMCTIVESLSHCVMFDAGAGKPVTRKRYLAGLKRNDLQCLVRGFISIPYFVLSHFDNDHWNILAWDESLRNKVKKILVPKVNKRSHLSVAFFDKKVIHKVEQTVAATIPLGTTGSVEIRRSQPTVSDSNGHALVSVVDIGGRRALLPGDYVYSRMKTDKEPSIEIWAAAPYAALVVPHHGDEASAMDVPPCTEEGKAFFSAGTHDTWNHPKPVSIANHKSKGYQTIHNRTEENIIRKTLI